MKIALNETRQGLNRARSQVNLASSRISRWGFDLQSTEGSQAVDDVQLDGMERPRNTLRQTWGQRGPDGLSPQINLTEEALRLKTGEWAFRANIAATKSVLDMQDQVNDLFDSKDD